MGLAKKSTTETLPTGTKDFRNHDGEPETKGIESGAAAAVARLNTTKVQPKSEAHSGYKQRDFDARG